MARNIRLILSYEGTNFSGWQRQPRDRSVQGVLEEALERLHGSPVPLVGSGRTDAGVHALGQTANFRSVMPRIPGDRFRDALNARLPQDVRILESREVSWDFHSRRDARLRCYTYYLFPGKIPPAPFLRFCWPMKKIPSFKVLDDLAAVLPGRRDFTSFTAAGDASSSKIRSISHAVFRFEGPFLVFRIAGNAFLWRMVRSLVGTLLELAGKNRGPEDLREILEKKDRAAVGITAPPQGLFLEKVLYG